MNNYDLLGPIFLLIILVGFYLAYLYGRKTKQFHWNEYIAIIILPVILIFALSYFVDARITVLFFVSCFLGFVFEYLTGLVYHKALNKKLWEYSRFNVKGYTSFLTIPLWGIAGVAFWFLSKMVGL